MSIEVVPILAFSDNYIWAIREILSNQVVIVDPGSAKPVVQYLQEHGYTLSAILITHHHADHQAGIPELLKAFPATPIYGPATESILGCTHPLKEGDSPNIPGLHQKVHIIDIPGHTAGHIAYFIEPDLCFCGDTLFSAGCGRLFEGTAEQMVRSLNKLIHLGDTTKIYCGHEYTVSNLRFAGRVEADNPDIQKQYQRVTQLRAAGQPSLPSTILIEKKTNPFLRCHIPDVINAIQAHSTDCASDYISLFAALRNWKNNF
jgi:hydroxyacylglutathione hydrolase